MPAVPTTFYVRYAKRVLDILCAGCALIILSPLLLFITIAIATGDGFPILYKQQRIGMGGQPFWIYKFRSMVRDADKIGPTTTALGDKRITKLGAILRATSLDELPQLINILKGDMSLVGYRPGVAADYRREDYEIGLFSIRPGLTGYVQVNGRSELSTVEGRQWELRYVRDISLKTDIKIVLQTIKVVLFKKGVN